MLRQAMKGVTRMLGAKVWDYTLIGLTHGRVLPPTLDQTYGAAASLRVINVDHALGWSHQREESRPTLKARWP